VVLTGRTLLAGRARGPVAAIAPLSFWGGYDPCTGRVTDRSHAAFGRALGGTVLVMSAGRGSSSSASVLAEAVRLGTAPAAIVLAEPDTILLAGAVVAVELYGRACPVAILSPTITNGSRRPASPRPGRSGRGGRADRGRAGGSPPPER
jgi:predicted aconitase with swiveling domain